MAIKTSRKFNFKSTGEIATEQDIQEIERQQNDFSIGVRFPLARASEVGSTFEMSKNFKDSVKQNFINWMQTNWGERLGEYNFGANLIQLLPEFVQENNQNAVKEALAVGIATYFPFITIESFQILSFQETPSLDIYTIRVIYSARDVFEGPDSISLTLKYLRV